MGAVVLTTDAAPMNELIDACCGLLLASAPGAPMGLTRRHHVAVSAIEEGVLHALRLSVRECTQLGDAARARFLERDAAFRERLAAALCDAPRYEPAIVSEIGVAPVAVGTP